MSGAVLETKFVTHILKSEPLGCQQNALFMLEKDLAMLLATEYHLLMQLIELGRDYRCRSTQCVSKWHI